MSTEQTTQVTFAIALDAERIDVQDVARTISDLHALLCDIEKAVRGVERATVEWAWADENPNLEVVASVNGANMEELSRIVVEAREGFASAEAAVAAPGHRVHWPDNFGPVAQKKARNILSRLHRLNSITVRANPAPPLVITAAEVGGIPQIVQARPPRRLIHSVIDGRLDLISLRGRLRATITENGTNHVVRCSFPDGMMQEVTNLFTKRVIAEGLVNYRRDGAPISITDITSIRERSPGRPLEEFAGIAPSLIGGLTPEEFIDRMREDA